MSSEWLKCTRQNPCQICGKSDWCTYSADGSVACCMRIQSDKVARNGGWIHRLTDPPPKWTPPPKPKKEPPKADIKEKYSEMVSGTYPDKISELADRLGVSETALAKLGTVHAYNCTFVFPMKDETGEVIGMRYRTIDGRKWSEPGSRAGMFYADIAGTVIICEGATDTAAAISLGFNAIGRPSCRGQEEILKNLVSCNAGADFVLCPDKDAPGMEGALIFAQIARKPMKIIIPPTKDLREWLNSGATHGEVKEAIKNAQWINLK